MAYQPKSYKKFVATAATATLVASALAPAASAAFSDVSDRYKEAVDYLAAEKITEGYPGGKFGTNDNIKRQDAAVMIAKALGATSTGTYADAGFSDVPTDRQWAVNFLAEKEIVSGKAAGQFGANDFTTRGEMAKIIANAYELTADETNAFPFTDVSDTFKRFVDALEENGIAQGYENSTQFGTGDLVTRGQFALFIHRAEGSPVVNPETPEVVSVSAINLKTILVTFNTELDATSAELAANYTYTGSTTVASRELQADKKSVLLTLTGSEAQQGSATLKVEGVTDTNGLVVATSTKTIKFLDTTVPSAVSASLVGPTKVHIKFSEPVTANTLSNAAFSLDNNTYSLSGTPTLVAGTLDTIEITLGTVLPAGSHTIKVNPSTVSSTNAVKDFAGFVVPTTDVTFNYAQDTTAPVASLVSATQTTAVFKFDDAVQFAGSGVMNTDFTVYHTYNNQPSYQGNAVLGADGKTLTVSFAAPIPEGNVKFFLNNTTDASLELEDAWGNKVSNSTFNTTVTADNTAPTVTKVAKFDSTHVDVTFSEAVTGVATGDFTLTDSTGANVAITGIGFVSGNTYRLTTAALNGNTYTLKVAADSITDTSINANKIAAYQTTFVVADTVAPTVVSTGSYTADEKKVFVKFSEAMTTSGAGSVLDVNNYRFTSATGTNPSALPANTSITLGADGKSVVITFAAAVTGLGNGNFAGITVAQVKDLAGNSTTSLSNLVTLSASDLVDANISKVKATSRNTISFEVDSNLYSIDVSKFTVDGVAATSAVYVNNSGKSTVTVTGPANQWNTSLTDLAANNVVIDAAGLVTDNNISNSGAINVTGAADYVSATITGRSIADTDADAKYDTVVVTFSEALQAASVAYDAFTVEGYTVSNVVASGNTVTLSLTEKTVSDIGATPKVQLVKPVRDNSPQFNVTNAENAGVNVAATVTGVAGGLSVTTQGVDAVQGEDTLTFTAGFAAGDTIEIDGVVLTGADGASTATTFDTSTDTASALAAAVKASVDLNTTLNTKYSVTDDGAGVLTFTQLAGQESATALAVTDITVAAGTAVEANTTVGVVAETEVATLAITSGATNSGTIAVTISGTTTNVAVTAGDTADQVATKIATALTVAGYNDVASTGNVVLTSTTPGAKTDLTGTVSN